jgi:hypothetical protein
VGGLAAPLADGAPGDLDPAFGDADSFIQPFSSAGVPDLDYTHADLSDVLVLDAVRQPAERWWAWALDRAGDAGGVPWVTIFSAGRRSCVR